MTRDELIALLQQRRNNDVRVYVPIENGGAYVLRIEGVQYVNGDYERGDFIAIDTEIIGEEKP